jgi:hypothetical protein
MALLHRCVDLFEQLREGGALLALERSPFRTPDVEAVAAGDHQVVDAHQLLDDGAIAAADHAYGAAAGQLSHHLAHALGDDRILRAIDDWRERAVVVEEDRDALAGHPLDERLRVTKGMWQPADVRATDAHGDRLRAAAAWSATTPSWERMTTPMNGDSGRQ